MLCIPDILKRSQLLSVTCGTIYTLCQTEGDRDGDRIRQCWTGYAPTSSCPFQTFISIPGGVIYPIMFQRLFTEVGFAWTVRIDGFLSLFLGLFAFATVTSTRAHGRTHAPLFDTNTFRDVPFMTVCMGCMIVSISALATCTFC